MFGEQFHQGIMQVCVAHGGGGGGSECGLRKAGQPGSLGDLTRVQPQTLAQLVPPGSESGLTSSCRAGPSEEFLIDGSVFLRI